MAENERSPTWKVTLSNSSAKQREKVPATIRSQVDLLLKEMEILGPIRRDWKNFGSLKGGEGLFHCHIKKGKPTYVACWKITSKKEKKIEVYYVGTHEGSPY